MSYRDLSVIFRQAKEKGVKFSIIFFLFFFLCVVPLISIIIISWIKSIIPIFIISLITLAIILFEIRKKELFRLSILLVVLNFTLWFVLGILTFVQGLFSSLPVFITYILLVPYSTMSGYVVWFLFYTSSGSEKRALNGSITVSCIIASVASMTNVIISLGSRTVEQVSFIESFLDFKIGFLSSLIENTFFNPVLGFFLILFLFNEPFVRHFLKFEFKSKSKSKRFHDFKRLLLYLIPIALFFLFYFLNMGF